MKNTPDWFQGFGPRIVAQPTSTFKQLQRSADLPIELLQDRLWHLFPIRRQSRLAPNAKIRIEDATADLDQLRRWACELPDCNWGLATGAASGVFILEMDTRSASNALGVLCEDDWDWRQTLLMSAGSVVYGFFRWPAGGAMRRSGKTPAQGLRVLGEGDHVLVPPSVGTSGIPYVYLDPDAAIAAAPQWLLNSVFVAFPNSLSQEALTTARPPGLSDNLLPFVRQVCPSDRRYRVYVYMSFQFHSGRWMVRFKEKDLRTQLPRTLNLASAEELIALADRGSGLSNLEARQALDLAIATRRGGLFLSLTTEQYSRLQMHSRPTGACSNAGRGA